ncbi:hypothetical protein D3C75_563230 [compost metagenome]
MSHSNSVIYADRIEFKRNATSFANRFLNDFTELLQMHMPWNNINIGIADRNKRLSEIFFFYSGCSQETTVWSTVKAFFNHV